MSRDRKRIGELFVEDGTITEKTLQRALTRASNQQRRLGYILEDMGVVTGEEIAQALANQYGFEIIRNLADYGLTPELRNLCSVEIAFGYMLFPLKITGNKLHIATADPTDSRIMNNISKNHNLEIVPFVASRSDIIAAINKNYLGKDVLASNRKTILVAGDSPDVHTDIENILSGKGYRIVIAKDGIQAFKMTLSESPCVVLTEKNLLKLDGYRLIAAMKNLPEAKHIPSILLSDGNNPEEELIAYNHGFFEYIKTPVDHISLITKVKKAIDAFDKAHHYR